MPIGAEPQPGGGVHFRIWAPKPDKVVLHVDGTDLPLENGADGYRSAFVASARTGSRYGYRIDGEHRVLPDPASRAQPDGPHELSSVVDPNTYKWSDKRWAGVQIEGQVIYEFHVGTFTAEGTWSAAAEKLPLLREIGISV